MTSKTSALAVDIAGDKRRSTRQLLESAGLLVPPGKIVRTADEAVEAAKRIGFPVVVKPLDGNHGRGVALDLTSVRAVRRAFTRALKESRRGWVVVEGMVSGRDYRLLVIGGHMVAVAERAGARRRRREAHGARAGRRREHRSSSWHRPREGAHTHQDRRRRRGTGAPQGQELDGVPDTDVMVLLAATGNMSTGGSAIDRTWDAHEDNVEIAEEAARVVGLDVAGIDFIAPDITVPVREAGGAIVEVNAAPGFRMHTHPTEGEPQYVARPVIDLLFPAGSPSRIPIVAVTGSNGKTTTVRMIAHVMKNMGNKVGLTSTDGIYIDGRLTKRVDASGPRSAQTVLQNLGWTSRSSRWRGAASCARASATAETTSRSC